MNCRHLDNIYGPHFKILKNTPDFDKYSRGSKILENLENKILNILKNISYDKTKNVLFYFCTRTLEKILKIRKILVRTKNKKRPHLIQFNDSEKYSRRFRKIPWKIYSREIRKNTTVYSREKKLQENPVPAGKITFSNHVDMTTIYCQHIKILTTFQNVDKSLKHWQTSSFLQECWLCFKIFP